MKASLPILAAALIAAPAFGQAPAAAPKESYIPYVGSNGISDWRADGSRALFIQGSNGRWYHVRTMNECPKLKSALTLGFQTSALDQLDRHGAILVEGSRCPIDSLVRSDPPPHPKKR